MITSRRFASLVFVAAALWSVRASAQVTTQTTCLTPGDTTSTTTATPSTDGVAAAFSTQTSNDQCYFVNTAPLRKAECTSPHTISLQWAISAAEYATGGTFEIFPAPSNASCATATPSTLFYSNPVTGVPLTEPLFPSSDGLYEPSVTMDTKAVLDSGGCCDDTAGGSSSGTSSGDGSTTTTGSCDGAFFNICVVVLNESVSPPGQANAYVQFWVDTVAPGQVVSVTATPGDGRISVSWPAVTGALTYNVTVTTADGKVVATYTTANAVTTAAINNLTNGVEYTVTVQALDFAKNEGLASDPVKATPQDQCDFWECYAGKEKGGFCFISTAAYGSYDASTTQVFRDFRDRVLLKSSAGEKLVLWYYAHGARPAVWLAQHAWARRATAIALYPVAIAAAFVVRAGPGTFALICTVLLLLLASIRRARAVWLVLALLAVTRTSSAAGIDDPGIQDEQSVGSDIPDTQIKERPRFGIGLKLGPYRPNIDSDPAALGIYRRYFGQSDPVAIGAGRKLFFDGDVDLYLYRGVGLLGLTGSAGYWTASAKSLVCQDATGLAETCTPQLGVVPAASGIAGYKSGSDTTNFNLVPLGLSVVYKFDYLYQRWHVPVTPLVRGGIDGVFWWIDGSGRGSVNRSRTKGQGLTWGYHVRPGVEISLDWLEPDSARRAFQQSGIFSSSLTFEWIFNKIDDFGNKKSWDLSDSSFLAGVELNL